MKLSFLYIFLIVFPGSLIGEDLQLDIFNEPVEMSKISREVELRLKIVSTLLQEAERASLQMQGLEF